MLTYSPHIPKCIGLNIYICFLGGNIIVDRTWLLIKKWSNERADAPLSTGT